ncbi:hypothetical protein J5N97_026395 [Dioscorea zingiberensis]|uniref:Disease resistance protein RPM1-like n=1 Tax=Dioscorea zingiberensis TaxID=325984 RepID=A0A9D5C287_9LILI|nr:hypothetical protein J5N97_026395 [Dioscorea zingiberensis]
MAEYFVCCLIENIADASEGLANSFIAPLADIKSKMKTIKSEFLVMKAFLKDAGAVKEHDEAWRAWVEQVRDVGHKVEDILDEFSHLMAQRQSNGFLYKIFHDIKHLKVWYGMAKLLHSVEHDLQNLSSMKHRYGIKTSSRDAEESSSSERRDQVSRRLAETTHFIEEDEVVGFNEHREWLARQLISEEPRRTTISVWGMGGVGKTTLATNVYKNIKNRFDCSAWICVSQKYETIDILRRIIVEFHKEKRVAIPDGISSMDYRRLVEMLHEYLQEKRYLIVLDDVWRANAWFDTCAAFLENRNRSRVIITTRNGDVTELGTVKLRIEPLSIDVAWELFCRKAFWKDMNKICPQELEFWARKMVDKCDGLPLAIVVIGRFLSLKEQTEEAWKKVYDDLCMETVGSPGLEGIENILNLSFNDLPHHLKNCFLLCAIFPEDSLINTKKLMSLWMAEGFVIEKGIKTKEEVAEDYLKELIHRCMLQVAYWIGSGIMVCCRIHDLLRDLAVTKSRRENFCVVCDDYSEGSGSFDKARRLSYYRSSKDDQFSTSMPHLRSFFSFSDAMFSCPTDLISQLSNCKLLRVLDIEGAPVERLPDEVFNLFNLQYLGLKETKIRKLPNSVGRLGKLQTLDVAKTRLVKLPQSVVKLKNLRHLLLYKSFLNVGLTAPKRLSHLSGLRTLQGIEADDEMIQQLGNLTKMRSLGVYMLKRAQCSKLCASIARMNQLVILSISADPDEALQLDGLNSPPSNLQKVWLKGKLENHLLPNWFDIHIKLTELSFWKSQLREDQIHSLGSLPNLRILTFMHDGFHGQKMSFRRGKFQRLNCLLLHNLSQLNWIEIENGSLKNLEGLFLEYCMELKAMPGGIENVTTLRKLELKDMPQELIRRVQETTVLTSVQNGCWQRSDKSSF